MSNPFVGQKTKSLKGKTDDFSINNKQFQSNYLIKCQYNNIYLFFFEKSIEICNNITSFSFGLDIDGKMKGFYNDLNFGRNLQKSYLLQ